jgi:subtilisin-like proprotein convertase family protein
MSKRLSAFVLLTLVAGCASQPFKPKAVISDVEPNRAAAGRSVQVEIHGDFTKWKDSSLIETDVSFGEGITVDSLTVANESFLIADLTIAPGAALGPRDVSVAGEEALGVFQVVAPFEVQESVLAGAYAFVTITGEGTDWLDGLTNVTTPSEEVLILDVSVEAPNLIRALVLTDLFAEAGGFDLAINGVTIDDSVPGALAVGVVTPTVLSANANAAGTVGGNDVIVLRIPAGAIGDVSGLTFLSEGTNDDVDVLVFNEDSGLIPIADPDIDDLYESIAFGNGDKDLYVTIQDFFLTGAQLPFEYDFTKSSLNPAQVTTQLTAQTIAAAGAQNWYYYSGTKWNLSTVTVTPNAMVPSIDPVLTISRDGTHEPVPVNSTVTAFAESATYLNGALSNAFLTVEDAASASGADTEYTVAWSQAPVAGDHFEAQSGALPIPDAVGSTDGVVVSTLAVAADPTGGAGITTLHVLLDVGHTYQSDLYITLEGPDGTTVTIWDEEGGAENGILHAFPDTYALDLSAFETLDPVGTWTLTVTDLYVGDAGMINNWGISIE